MSDDFWENLVGGHINDRVPNAIDQKMAARRLEEDFEDVRLLTEAGRSAVALRLPVEAGTRVAFLGNLGSLFTYSDTPDDGAQGEVVKVRSATGNITSHDGRVFVKFDDGQLRTICAEHLRSVSAPEKIASFKLTPEEVERSRVATGHNGREYSYTIVARKQDDGRFVVAAVDVSTGEAFGFDPQVVAGNRVEVFKAANKIKGWVNSLWGEKKAQKASPAPSKRKATRFGDSLPVRFRVASLGDIADMFSPPGLGNIAPMLRQASGELVHKATNDLWSFSKASDGQYVVSRLFDDTGEPLKG